jgi:biopolymer transport protein ExbD
MAMTVGGSKHGPVSDPNVVPLIDVLLVLIIIFMVITPSTNWIAHSDSTAVFAATETRATQSPNDRGAGVARRGAHDHVGLMTPGAIPKE